MLELGLLHISGINEACQIALEKDINIKLIPSPFYKENCRKEYHSATEVVTKINGYKNSFKKVILDISSVFEKGYMEIYLEDLQ